MAKVINKIKLQRHNFFVNSTTAMEVKLLVWKSTSFVMGGKQVAYISTNSATNFPLSNRTDRAIKWAKSTSLSTPAAYEAKEQAHGFSKKATELAM